MLFYASKRIGRYYFQTGVLRGIAIGFSIDRYHLMLDFGIFWFGVEW